MSTWNYNTMPTCVSDFEDQRGIYEGTIYGSFFFVCVLLGLPLRCCLRTPIRQMWANRLPPSELNPQDHQTATWFLKVVLVLSPVPIVAIIYAYAALFPHCNCNTNTMTCDVCRLSINGVPFGSCYKAATGFGVLFMFLSVAICLTARGKLQTLQQQGISYANVGASGSTELV